MATTGNIAEKVKNANRSEIARVTGIHLSHVSKVLAGKRTPSGAKLAEIARVLQVTMDELHLHLLQLRNRVARRRTAA